MTMEEIYRCLFRVEFYSTHPTNVIAEKIEEVLKTKEEQFKENLRLHHLSNLLKAHSKKFYKHYPSLGHETR